MDKSETENQYIYGRNSILEAISSNKEIEKIFISFGTKGDAISRIFSEAKKAKIPCTVMDKWKFSEMERKACPKGVNSQGAIALISPIDTVPLEELLNFSLSQSQYPVLVALDGITDPHNLGAIARSVECSGASGIILPVHDSAPITAVAIKASAGALEHIPVTKVNNLTYALNQAKDYGFWIVGTDSLSKKLYTDKIYDRPVIIVIGSEGKGMRPISAKHCDMLVKIPLAGKIESLNASVSAGIILFEIVRQRSLLI
jgi:23S rRNA (guanosine2251-2'-O)-methyltransferase